MDLLLLTFFNETIANPILDIVMIALTYGGFAMLPALGVVLLVSKEHRSVGLTILIALVVGFILAVTFQHLTLRPRPDFARHIVPPPNFPSYPSGHATAAFSVALIIGLAYRQRRWWVIALTGAGLIALSRVYLGHHYPSDLVGGTILGAAIGAVCYGLFIQTSSNQIRWRWLLWLQVAIALIITQMAYLSILPLSFLRWPFADKALHFLLIGSVAFWLNLWLNGRRIRLGQFSLPWAIIVPLTIALLEEGLQMFSPVRTASFSDLFSDIAGLLFFWWLSELLLRKHHKLSPSSFVLSPQIVGSGTDQSI